MWLNIVAIALASFGIILCLTALRKIKRAEQVAKQYFNDAIKLSEETAVLAEKVGRDIDAITKELNRA